MAGCRLSLAMTSRPLGVTIPTLEFPTAPFRGRGRCRRWHQGWIGPIVRWIESGLMNGATGSVVHSGITTYFLYHAPLGRRCAMLKQERVQMQHWTGHSADLSHTANNRASRTLKPATQGARGREQRITEFLKGKLKDEPVLISRSNVSSNT